ncbi:MAG TPA: hypothetical protein VNK43_05170 [Gemmatimonadales bacterium]|nr:hypothetical protein [Gemmatimonadales bacterium]
MSASDPLAGRFAALWRRLVPDADPAPVWRRLAAGYGEPHRAYHDLRHVARCLEHLDSVRELAARPDEAEAALWFHDAVYDPHRHDNEERSAEWARAALLAGGADRPLADRVAAMVLATRHTGPPPAEPPDAALVVDVDLAILGAEPAELERYERGVRQEYAWVPEPAFRAGRRAVLEALLGREWIYATPPFRRRLEARARENLRRMLAALGD